MCGGVTVALDDGTGVTLIEGRNRCVHQSVSAPGVAAVVTVDELGKRPAVAPPNRNSVYSLPEGIVPGRGAVVWSKDADIRTAARARIARARDACGRHLLVQSRARWRRRGAPNRRFGSAPNEAVGRPR